MLKITIPAIEQWDELNQEFVYINAVDLRLEHSLISISKWEAKWCKPFLSNKDKTFEETIDYVRCMTLNSDVDDEVYEHLTSDNIKKIDEYINAPMTATYFSKSSSSGTAEVITSELIYYWMISQNIPFECQKWHINRLITLIRVCVLKNLPPKKMSSQEIMRRNAALNEERKKRLNTSG